MSENKPLTIKELIEAIRADNPAPADRGNDPIVGDVVSFDYHGKARQGVVEIVYDNAALLLRHTDNASRYRDENDRPKAKSRYSADKMIDLEIIDRHTS